MIPHPASEEEIKSLIEEKKLSVREICKLCKISFTKYYRIKRNLPFGPPYQLKNPKKKLARTYLLDQELEYIRTLATDPNQSFSIREMCLKFGEKFGFTPKKGLVYYHLTKTLGFSFKRNVFVAEPATIPTSKFAVFNACKQFLDMWYGVPLVISVDESGFDLGIVRDYGYARKGEPSRRLQRAVVQKINVVMAVTNSKVLAYQMRKGSYNEHAFAAFIIDIARKLLENNNWNAVPAVIFMDNAGFHKSNLLMKLYSLLPFRIVFNAPYSPQINPIEYVFGLIKQKVKQHYIRNMYCFGTQH
jgi:transposase